jgi:aliphatic nitrilase
MCKCFVINACGTINDEMRQMMEVTDDDRAYLADPKSLGGSTIIGSYGEILAGPGGPGEEILYADADLTNLVRAKLVHDFSGHYQRHDIFRLELGISAPHLPPTSVRGARDLLPEVKVMAGVPANQEETE